MSFRFFVLLLFINLLSCAPIQIEHNLETQSTVQFSSFEERSISSIDIEIHEEEPEAKPIVDYGLNFIQTLSNTLYENSFCKCDNNNDCSRGCSKQKGTCTGKKLSDKFTKNCMRHVTGSIMYTIDLYCKKMNIDTPKDQCLKDIEKLQENNNSKYNICRQSLFYPSALCILNLDGQNRINTKTIKNRTIRNNCKKYSSLNGNIKYFYANLNNKLRKLPIFIETPLTEELPFGSLVVLQSSNPNGHVEIKTNKKLCDGSYCFCSDFCISREKGWKSTYKPLVAFRWNPLFINHLGQWEEKNHLNFIY